MKLFLALMSVVLVGTSSLGIADKKEPVTEIALGLYEDTKTSWFGEPIKVTTGEWVDEYTLETCLKYRTRCFKAKYTIERVKENFFEGTGKMDLFEGCSYEVSIKVKAFSDRLFIKESSPPQIHLTPDGSSLLCYSMTNTENVHQEPYLKIK